MENDFIGCSIFISNNTLALEEIIGYSVQSCWPQTIFSYDLWQVICINHNLATLVLLKYYKVLWWSPFFFSLHQIIYICMLGEDKHTKLMIKTKWCSIPSLDKIFMAYLGPELIRSLKTTPKHLNRTRAWSMEINSSTYFTRHSCTCNTFLFYFK